MEFTDIETPTVFICRRRLQQNIQRMQDKATHCGVRLRPHIKTHKCVEIARLQMRAGACGLTAAKADEALVFLNAGIHSVTVAYPLLNPVKVDRLIVAAIRNQTDLRLIVDSREGLACLEDSAGRHHYHIGVYIKIDVGLHRCGIPEGDQRIGMLARRINSHPLMTFHGLLSHAGHAYAAPDRNAVLKIAEAERRQLIRIKAALENDGVAVPELSVGATPTALAAEKMDGITEIRPGNYIFLDQTPLRLELAAIEQVALTVIATVISKNVDFMVIDAGAKTLALDQGAHGVTAARGFGIAYPATEFAAPAKAMTICRLSEEHGFIDRQDGDLALGTLVRIVPNHACPVANLATGYRVWGKDGWERWPVDARALVR